MEMDGNGSIEFRIYDTTLDQEMGRYVSSQGMDDRWFDGLIFVALVCGDGSSCLLGWLVVGSRPIGRV